MHRASQVMLVVSRCRTSISHHLECWVDFFLQHHALFFACGFFMLAVMHQACFGTCFHTDTAENTGIWIKLPDFLFAVNPDAL